MVRKGLFVSIEGTTGAGKTALCRHLRDRLRAAGIPVYQDAPGGDLVKAMESLSRLLKAHGKDLDALPALLTRTALRAEYVAKVVRPVLTSGAVLIADTFADTENAASAAENAIAAELVSAMTSRAVEDAVPDLTIILDGLPAAFVARIPAEERADVASEAFQRKTRAALLHFAEQEPNRYKIINAENAAKYVQSVAWSAVKDALRARGIPFTEDEPAKDPEPAQEAATEPESGKNGRKAGPARKKPTARRERTAKD